MIKAVNSNTRVAPAEPPPYCDFYDELRNQLNELVAMADLSANHLEYVLEHERLGPNFFGDERDVSYLVMIGQQTQDQLLFAAGDVHRRALEALSTLNEGPSHAK